MTKHILVYIVLVILKMSPAFSQQPYMWHLSDENGLPSNEVYQIFQDSKGYIWMGTDNGVAKYDGNVFRVLTCDGQQGRAISYFEEDSKGRIWCINFSGQIFWIENDSLHLLSAWTKFHKYHFPTIKVGDQDELYILSGGNNIYKYHIDTKVFEELKIENSKENSIVSILPTQNVLYYMDFIRGPFVYNKNRSQPIQSNVKELNLKTGLEFSKQKNGEILLFNKISKSLFKYKNGKMEVHKINQYVKNHTSTFTNLLVNKEGEIYLTSYDGIVYFKDENALPQYFLKGEQVSNLMQDREGNLWFGTLKNGVYVMPNKKIMVINSQNSALPPYIPSFLTSDNKGNIYCSQNNGYISIINAADGTVKKVIDVGIRKDCEMLQYDHVSGKIFTTYNELREIKQNATIEKVKPVVNHVKGVSMDMSGNLIVADAIGSYILNDKFEKKIAGPYMTESWMNNFKWLSFDDSTRINPRFVFNLWQQRTRTLFHDYIHKTIWVSFSNGISYFKDGIKHNLLDSKGNEIVAYKFAQDDKGRLWAGTTNHGLICIENYKITKQLTTKNGLLSNFIKSISISKNGVWFFAEKGVQYYNFNTQKIQTFSLTNGLISSDVTDILAAGGKIWICTSRGIQFFPVDMNLNSVIAPIAYITGIAISEHDTILKNNLEFKYNQNNIRIAIVGLSYSSRGHFSYRYRMIGLDSNWIETNSRNNFARFSSLPPGSYTFEVVAVNENGLASNPSKLSFTITKPFWLQWWFIGFITIVLGATVWWIYRVRLNSVKIKAKVLLDKTLLEQNLRASELTALKAQMNPHFIFNALNSIQEFILLNDKQTAQKYLGKFSDLMRLYLDMSQHQTISLDDEIKTLKLYLELESIRFEESFTYELNISEGVLGEDKKIPPMIIQPYIENALKHGLLHKKNNRKLIVSFELQSNNTLSCIVEDNGIGRVQSFEINKNRIKKFTSFSTGATNRRLELLNHGRTRPIGVEYIDLKGDDGIALGTRVIMLIPLD